MESRTGPLESRSGRAEVVELYPGAAERRPIRQSQSPRVAGGPSAARRRSRRSRGVGRFRFAVRVARRRFPAETAEAGMATAEYAIATLAAVAFAGLLVVIMRSDEVRGFLLAIVRTALALP
ncbi:DUF4244 domain-containing protein [Sinomonas susongensis]|uniref:DUF4244 domain-containing protein n=1 Tax=Sinomonas susongensis TaxID=1324851 RepID=UPI003CCC4F2E